jgi:hypothetical protein
MSSQPNERERYDTHGDVVLSMESSATGPAPAPVAPNGLLPSASGRSEN